MQLVFCIVSSKSKLVASIFRSFYMKSLLYYKWLVIQKDFFTGNVVSIHDRYFSYC